MNLWKVLKQVVKVAFFRLHLFLGVLRLVSVLFYGLVVYHAKHVKLYLPTNRETVYATELRENELQKQDDMVKVKVNVMQEA